MSAYGFHNSIVVFLRRKSKLKFLLASKISLTNCETPSSNSNPVTRKPAMNVHSKKSTNESKG
jgi:hypothetical protein